MKLTFFDINNREYYYKCLSVLSVVLTISLAFFDIPKFFPNEIRLMAVLISFFILYVIIWEYNKRRKNIFLRINHTDLEIKVGDIFNEKKSLKVIPFNECFDTIVGNGIISNKTLNGIFIEKYYNNNVDSLDIAILDSLKSQNYKPKNISCKNGGKGEQYKLGTIAKVNDFLLTAFTRFDTNNNSYLEIDHYFSFLMAFWYELDKIYNGCDVTIPIFGAGITRFKITGNRTHISHQKLIEIIIWTYKLTNIKFDSKITIIIYHEIENEINLLDLKRISKNNNPFC